MSKSHSPRSCHRNFRNLGQGKAAPSGEGNIGSESRVVRRNEEETMPDMPDPSAHASPGGRGAQSPDPGRSKPTQANQGPYAAVNPVPATAPSVLRNRVKAETGKHRLPARIAPSGRGKSGVKGAEISDSAVEFVRNQPLLAMSMAVFAGALVARLLASRAPE
ncbi:MAG: hypothetical protein JO366_18120 [Methylobacteriaceae bacterium]|nr:hypothetical protein [Methylobacteriaceae bacterium]MBV9633406.1 hypothetical protein [Methylobacteriaceae bacterium]